MASQLYVMPITGTGTETDSRRPKYADTDLAGHAWAAMDFGNEPFMLVATATNATLSARGDVITLPLNLDTTLTAGNVVTVKAALEAVHIPAQWVTTGMTYRAAVKTICQMFMFWQRCQGQGNPQIFTGGVTQDTAFSALPAGTKLILSNAAGSFGIDASSFGTSTLRQIFVFVAANIPAPANLLDVVL